LKVVVITHNYIRREGDLTALYLHRLSSGLVGKGLEIVVVCPHAPGLLAEDIINGVRIKRFGYTFSRIKPIVYTGNMHQEVAGSFLAKFVFLSFLWSFYRFALKICREEKTDLIWANWWTPPGLVAAKIATKLNLPLVISSHGTDISLLGKGGIISALSQYVYRRTSRATVVSSFLRKKLLDNVSEISAGNVLVIPMPVGMENFPKIAPPENEVPVFLSVARYTRQKRLDDIISAAGMIAEEGNQFKILMVGEGPLEKELKDLVGKKGLTERVEFIPLVAQQRLGELYRQADAIVLSSEGEGFGLVLVEAGLTGRAVIGARSGGITDIIIDGENGLLFNVGDIEALANCMRKLLTDRETRIKLGEGGYRRVIENFSTSILVERMYDLFVSLTGKVQESPKK
jgi:glycosyltransferase involved in cell wall biosynthesis